MRKKIDMKGKNVNLIGVNTELVRSGNTTTVKFMITNDREYLVLDNFVGKHNEKGTLEHH